MLKPPLQLESTELSVDHFAAFFKDKSEKTRSLTSTVEPPAFRERSAPGLSSFSSATVKENYLAPETFVYASHNCHMLSLQSHTQQRLSISI
jgi:hypothetical protein